MDENCQLYNIVFKNNGYCWFKKYLFPADYSIKMFQIADISVVVTVPALKIEAKV